VVQLSGGVVVADDDGTNVLTKLMAASANIALVEPCLKPDGLGIMEAARQGSKTLGAGP